MTESSTNPKTGGQLVAEGLHRHGVEKIFCVPGESYLEVIDALFDYRDAIDLVTCRHENGAANMAEAYGKLTGKAGVCMVTRGPGACNASIGVHTAFQDSTPMVLLIGQVARPDLGREAFQEVDYTQMFAPLAKAVRQIERAADVPETIAWAFHEAQSGRPGPVVVALPEDMLRESAQSAPCAPRPAEAATPALRDIDRLHDLLGQSRRPIMLVGGGGWDDRARADILAFAEAWNLPVCCSFRRHDIVDNHHRCFVGDMGIGLDPALLARFKGADLILVVGARLGEMTSQGYTLLEPGARRAGLVHVHPDGDELGKVFVPELGIAAAVGAFSAAVRTLTPGDVAWADWRAEAKADYIANRRPAAFGVALDLGAVMGLLDETLPADAVVTVDAGNFAGWPQRFLSFGGGRRLLGPTNGAMGYAVPACVAAAIADPARLCVACVGDGGFLMTGQEIATAIAWKARPIILVFNNNMLGTIRMHQERNHPGRVIATDLANPDFAALARAYGAFGAVVETTDAFVPAFEAARASSKPAVIELRTAPDISTTRSTLSAIRAQAQSLAQGT